MLALQLLGSPQILLNGQPVTGLSATKSQALLFALAVQGRPQSRLALAGLLWPDKPESDALANVRQALYHLRNALGDYLIINRVTVMLNPALPCQIDVLLFEQECAAANLLALRQAAVDRYAGDFLAGFYVENADPFEEWAVVMRERLHRLATTTLQDLVTHFVTQQETQAGLRYANQWLALEPWQEEAHRAKIQLLAWEGQTQAALTHYERCRHLLAEELGAEPSAETVALVEKIRRGEIEGKTRRQEDQTTRRPDDKKTDAPALSIQNLESKIQNQQDWGEMPDVRALWGRDGEVQQIEQWLVTEQQRIVTILGMGGMGKTTLAATMATRLAPQFAWVLWRSLLNAPPLSDILRDWVQTLAGYTLTTWPTLLDAQLALLFEQLRQQRCLLVLDNVESILSAPSEQPSGAYQPGYADYGQFFARLGESAHRSSMLLTSRELPPEVVRLERRSAPVRRLPLPGLPLAAGQHLLAAAGLIGSVEQQRELLTRYSGNPLALQLVGKTIQDFFAGEIAAFLSDETLLFDDVREMLEQQFARLTGLERELLLWLAIEREPVTLPMLQDALLYAGAKSAILDALLDLQQRSLLEKLPTGFTLQNVIMEYATAYLVDAVCHEIETTTPHLLHSHALLRAQAKAYVRESQARLLLHPIGQRLQKKVGRDGVLTKLKALLTMVRQSAAGRTGYAGGNILNLLVYYQEEGLADLHQIDFSTLAVWQAYLPGAELVGVNFAGSDLTNSIFAEQFGVIVALAFSPDGQILAAGAANDNKIRFWQVKNGQPLGVLVGHSGAVAELAFSPDGKRLASSSYDYTICLWDLQSLGLAAFDRQQPLHILRDHEAGVWCVAFSPDGKLLASGSKDQTVRLWDTTTGQLRHTLRGHTAPINTLTFRPDGQMIASSGQDCTVQLWHVASGQRLAQLNGHTKRIWRLAFSPDGEQLASGDWDHHIRVWDLADLPAPGAPEPLVIDQALVLAGHDDYITHLRFRPDGRFLLSCSDDRTLRRWDLAQRGTEVARYALQEHPGRNWFTDITADDAILAGAGGDLCIRLWDARDGQLIRRLQGHAQDVLSVAFDATGTLLAASCQDRKVRLWDMQTQTLCGVLRGHTDGVEDVAFCAPRPGQSALVVSSSVDQTIRLWDAQRGQLVQILRGHTSWVRSIAVSPDGSMVASASNDETVRLWSTATGELLQSWSSPAAGSWCWAVAFSPNGKTLAVGCRHDLIYLWAIDSPNPLPNPVTLRGHGSSITTLAFSPDGALLASGSFDQTIRLWQVATGETVTVLQGHQSRIWCVAFSPDGLTLASASEDQTLCLWDVASGQLRQRLSGHSGAVRGVTFSPDGKTVVSSSSDGTIKCWDSQTGVCLTTLAAPRPYEGMNISGVTGVSEAQKAALQVLGALTEAPVDTLAASPTRSLVEQKAQKSTTVQETTTAALSASTPHNLPQPATPFVGRANDLAELAAKLANPACRLLTLVGPGGMGKTRLAIQAAQMILDFRFWILDSEKMPQNNPKSKIQNLSWKDQKFADGVFFVGLASVDSSDLLVSTIAAALGFTFSGSGDPKTQLLAYLRAKSLLLVLDNFEHLLDGVALVSDLLTTAPGVKVLATSREALKLREEWFHFLSGMSYPATGASGQVETYTAIQLFTQCARQVQQGFDVASEAAAVTRICQLVEGMPLGIELAATWLKFYSCVQIAEEITRDLDFLTTALHNVPARHRSLRAIFEHSWRLLSPGEQYVLPRLAIFRDGFTQAAAEQVVGAARTVLLALVEKSLLQLTPARRFQFHELMRQFAEEKLLPEPQAAAIKDRHSLYYLRLLQEQEAYLKGRKQPSTTAVLEADIENVRTAWQWGVANQQVDAIDSALESLHTFYLMKYWFQEGETVFGQAVATLQMAEPMGKQGILSGKLLFRQGVMAVWFAWTAGKADHWEKAAKLYKAALAILSQFDAQAETGLALSALGALHFHLGRFAEANHLFAQALHIFSAQDNRVEMGRILHELGVNLAAQGNYGEAIQTLQQGGELCEQSGDIRMRGEILNSLAQVYMAIEEYRVAQQMMQAILSARTAAEDQRGMAASLALLGDLTWRMGDYATAQRYSQESLSLLQKIGLNKPKEVALNNLGNIACSLADYQQADEHFRTVLAINSTTGKLYYDRYVAVALNGLATVLINQGQLPQAAALLSLVIHHPATWQEMKNKATRLLTAFAAELPAGAMAAIQAQPQPQDLAAFIMPLLTAPQAEVQKVALNALDTREATGALCQPGNTTIVPDAAVSAPRLPSIALPAEVTSFIGREMELVLVQQRLADPACRLLTITGMGGVGKSRLALRAAHLLAEWLTHTQAPQFPDGIYYIPLAALEPHPQLEHLLATTVAATLGISLAGATTPTTHLLQALAEKDLLLILDNCEHLPVAAFINQLLQQAQAVKLLVTSRARLNVRGEQLIRLAGLTTPTATLPAQVTNDDLWRLNDHSAIRLFTQSVQAILPDFTLDATTAAPVVQICQLLHGLPLGIELAATWAQLLPLPEIVQEIRQNLDFLESTQLDAPAHQRSLRAVFNHSWQRLTLAEQQALRRLTVFTGGFTREAAAQVAGATLPLLAQLTDKSLMQRIDPGGETLTNGAAGARVRYELQPVVRQYAAEALAQAGETATYQARHAAAMAQFLATQRTELEAAKQQEALRAIHAEIENVRVAWQWLLAHLQTAQSSLAQIAEQVSQGLDSLFHFYDMRSWFQEGETIFGQLAQGLSTVIPPLSTPVVAHEPAVALWRLQAKAQARQGWFAFHLGRYDESRRLLTTSLHRLQQIAAEADTIFTLNYLGAVLRHLGEFAQAIRYLQEAQRLAAQHNDPRGASIALNILGQIALVQGDLAAARRLCQQALEIKRAIGDRWGMIFSLGYLGRAAQAAGEYVAAQTLFAECLTIARALDDQRGAAFALQCLGDTAYAAGDLTTAQAHYQESLAIYQAIGNRAESSITLARLGKTHRASGDTTQARQALREALALAWSLPSTPGLLAALLGLANLALDAGQEAAALPSLRFVAQHPASSQQQRQQATTLLAALGAAVTADNDWDLTAYVQTILREE
ncbi:MAG: tetratricopeptide repeat protein [Caldilineaceae bacterium]